ncbi:MAG: hypothetical protein LBR54_04530, partial [Oscillospiraceae bacterium]|nr:hypothetical protein [Oscillospiraceae bacterium]
MKKFIKTIICLMIANSALLCGCGEDVPDSPSSNSVPGRNTQSEHTPIQTQSPVIYERQPAEQVGGVVEIKEKMFVTHINDVYLNQEDYLGKTVKY